MSDFNKCILMGRLTRDPELRNTSSGQAVANIGLAVGHKYKTKSGEQREETAFVDCEAWGPTAETIARYLSKGRPVLVEGRLVLDQWQDRDGNNRSKLKLRIDSFTFVGDKPQASGMEAASEPAPAAGMAADEIPFSPDPICWA